MQSLLKPFINKFILNLKLNFYNDYHQWILWLPVLFGVGIYIYFQIPIEPPITLIPILFALLIIGYLYTKSEQKLLLAWQILFIIFVGFSTAMIKSHIIYSPFVDFENKYIKVQGIVEKIQPLSKGFRVIINHPEFPNFNTQRIPKKIRVTFKQKEINLEIADRVEFYAVLSKPPSKITPNSYDFARYAYFEQIGAVGFSTTYPKIIGKEYGIFDFINIIRSRIARDIINHMGIERGSITTSLMIGEYSAISKTLLENIRISGLAHILSVSGLHLAMISSLIFIVARYFLLIFRTIALNYNVKKIAACIAIFITFIYLLLTGSYVAAIRSFIMTSTFLIAIVIDRENTNLRSVCFAGLIILMIYPEMIIHPSFQMSFAAVLALVSVFNLLVKNGFTISNQHPLYKIVFFIISSALTSIIAGIATAPFISYHFQQFSQYSVLANMLVVPIISFYVMPLIVLGIFLYLTPIFPLILKLLGYGIDYFIAIANWTASLPNSADVTIALPSYCLTLIVIGSLWFLLWQEKWRYYGIIMIIAGLLMSFHKNYPDLFLTSDPNIFVLLDNQKRPVLSKKIRSEIKNQVISHFYGKEKLLTLDNYIYRELNYSCDNQKCLYTKESKKIVFDYKHYDHYYDCDIADIIILMNNVKDVSKCREKVISLEDLKKNGSTLIYLNKKPIVTIYTNNNNHRLWSKKN